MVPVTSTDLAPTVTVLAFVFVPISLASSIFGMNVQQINHSSHSIWAFVVTAVVVLTGSVLFYCAWRGVRNIKILNRFRSTIDEDRDLSFDVELTDRGIGRWRKMAYYLGLRRAEKAGLGVA